MEGNWLQNLSGLIMIYWFEELQDTRDATETDVEQMKFGGSGGVQPCIRVFDPTGRSSEETCCAAA